MVALYENKQGKLYRSIVNETSVNFQANRLKTRYFQIFKEMTLKLIEIRKRKDDVLFNRKIQAAHHFFGALVTNRGVSERNRLAMKNYVIHLVNSQFARWKAYCIRKRDVNNKAFKMQQNRQRELLAQTFAAWKSHNDLVTESYLTAQTLIRRKSQMVLRDCFRTLLSSMQSSKFSRKTAETIIARKNKELVQGVFDCWRGESNEGKSIEKRMKEATRYVQRMKKMQFYLKLREFFTQRFDNRTAGSKAIQHYIKHLSRVAFENWHWYTVLVKNKDLEARNLQRTIRLRRSFQQLKKFCFTNTIYKSRFKRRIFTAWRLSTLAPQRTKQQDFYVGVFKVSRVIDAVLTRAGMNGMKRYVEKYKEISPIGIIFTEILQRALLRIGYQKLLRYCISQAYAEQDTQRKRNVRIAKCFFQELRKSVELKKASTGMEEVKYSRQCVKFFQSLKENMDVRHEKQRAIMLYAINLQKKSFESLWKHKLWNNIPKRFDFIPEYITNP